MVQITRRKIQGAASSSSNKRMERILSFLGALNLIGMLLILYTEECKNSVVECSRLQQQRRQEHQHFVDYNLDQAYTLSRLRKLGITISDPDIRKRLPPWWMIQQQYGNESRILGLERCQQYRQSTPQVLLGPAGLFNSGTNLISQLMQNNCMLQNTPHHFAFQAPWGKHTPADYRGRFTIPHPHYQAMDMNAVLPIGTSIIYSMRPSHSIWQSASGLHPIIWVSDCPNLVDPSDNTTIPVTVHYGVGNKTYPTLLHLWNRWNRQYFDSISYPRLVLRMEDLLFYPKETISQICDCVGGKMDPLSFTAVAESAKGYAEGHGTQKTGLVDGWIKYGNQRMYKQFTAADMNAASEIVDKEMMEFFGYV